MVKVREWAIFSSLVSKTFFVYKRTIRTCSETDANQFYLLFLSDFEYVYTRAHSAICQPWSSKMSLQILSQSRITSGIRLSPSYGINNDLWLVSPWSGRYFSVNRKRRSQKFLTRPARQGLYCIILGMSLTLCLKSIQNWSYSRIQHVWYQWSIRKWRKRWRFALFVKGTGRTSQKTSFLRWKNYLKGNLGGSLSLNMCLYVLISKNGEKPENFRSRLFGARIFVLFCLQESTDLTWLPLVLWYGPNRCLYDVPFRFPNFRKIAVVNLLVGWLWSRIWSNYIFGCKRHSIRWLGSHVQFGFWQKKSVWAIFRENVQHRETCTSQILIQCSEHVINSSNW